MKLFAIAITCILASVCNAKLTQEEFESFIEERCFQEPQDEVQSNDDSQPRLVNGQENPLASTLENFIGLVEKFELANPSSGLKEELFYFIRNYTYDHIEFSPIGDIRRWKPAEFKAEELDTFWEPDERTRTQLPVVSDPFSEAEKCALFYAISYAVVPKARRKEIARSAANGNNNNNNTSFWKNNIRQFNPAELYPMEQGVVSIRGSESSFALGKVLTGLYVGLREAGQRNINLEDYSRINREALKDHPTQIDPLYALTLAEVITQATWRAEVGKRQKLAGDGDWMSMPVGDSRQPLDTREVCPMVYKFKSTNVTEAFGYNAVKGAADGLILGKVIGSVVRNARDVKLSQVLRMYYSRGGLVGEAGIELGMLRASFCGREEFINRLDKELREQVRLYIVLASTSYKQIDANLEYTIGYFNEKRREIFGSYSSDPRTRELSDYCRTELTLEKPENWPLESALDIIAVMDTSFQEEPFARQQLILGYLAKQLQLSAYGSRMTILSDHRISPANTAEAKVQLKPIVDDTFSSACAACTVTQISYRTLSEEGASAPDDEVVIAVDQLLQAKKDNETRRNGVNGKVVIFFNFEENKPTDRPTTMQSRVGQALSQLHLRHMDTLFYASGRNEDVLKRYARNDLANVLIASDSAEKDVADLLFKKISEAPATLQYRDCEDGRGETSAIVEDFVSPNAIQHWEMPAQYFHRSNRITITFEAPNGPIKVCYSRATRKPEQVNSGCNEASNGNKAEFKISNPCKGFTPDACAPFYFSVLGKNDTVETNGRREYCTDNTNTENKCKTLDQIKFRVLHEGIRCSGCINLIASSVLIWIGILFARIF